MDQIALKQAFEQAGISPPDRIVFDGKIRRFSTNNKEEDTAGFYCFWDHGNDFIAGYFGDWRTDVRETWHSKKGLKLDHVGQQEMARQIEQAKEKSEEERRLQREKAAKEAGELLAKAAPASTDHPYLKKKGIKPHGLSQLKNKLLIPVLDEKGEKYGLQMIGPDGEKWFLLGTNLKGHFFTIQGEPGRIYIGEGFATCATIHEATGQTVICAFNAGNLLPVAEVIRRQDPEAEIVIAGDDDQWTAGNPGRTKAEEGARAINGLYVFPEFRSLESKPTDFNDLHVLESIEAVTDQLARAVRPGSLFERIERATLENYKPLLSEIAGVKHLIDRDICCKKLAKKLGIPVDVIRQVVNP